MVESVVSNLILKLTKHISILELYKIAKNRI